MIPNSTTFTLDAQWSLISLEFISEKSVNLVEGAEDGEKNEAQMKKKTMWQRWKRTILKNLIAFILLAAMYALYIISLGTCPYSYDDPNVCIGFFRRMYPIWLLECIISGILWVTVFLLSVEKVFSRLWIPVMIGNF